ncbi:MAG: hypothetical protein ACLFVJ_15770 [Persicimonas sp.]
MTEEATVDTIDWKARKEPETYKPLIDDAILRIARAAGADEEAIGATLEEQSPTRGPWDYLTDVVGKVRDDLVTDELRDARPWFFSFLDGTFDRYLETYYCVETQADAGSDPFDRPLVLEYYPEEAHECLRQETYVGGADADIYALWNRGNRYSVCHAHMEGFWILGEDPTDFIENIADKTEEELAG